MSVVIVDTKRTPIGKFMGALSSYTAPELGSVVIKSLNYSDVDEVIMGCVLPAGLGQAPARQAAMLAGLPPNIGATTVNKVCGSGMKAIMFAHDMIQVGSAKVIIAGGMESMTNAPHLLQKTRFGYRLGHREVYDHMYLDGLEDAYDKGRLMGSFAELCAKKFFITRKQQDDYALISLQRAKAAPFENEIIPVGTLQQDELPMHAKPEKIPFLKPAFKKNGTITAANASGISDGASAHLLMTEEEARRRNLRPLAKIVAHATHAQAPAWFTTAPIEAIIKVVQKAQWSLKEVDLFEINEAFAVVVLAAMQRLELPHEKVNIHGGACALGHPLGASGARILTTLIYALKQHHLKKGVAALCLGGGEATAIAVELCPS